MSTIDGRKARSPTTLSVAPDDRAIVAALRRESLDLAQVSAGAGSSRWIQPSSTGPDSKLVISA